MIASVKRHLGPLRPVLAPIYRRIRALGDTVRPMSPRILVERSRYRLLDAIRRARGEPERLRALRRHEIVALAADVPSYYKARVGYLSAAARAADDLIERRHLTTALELGPNLQPLIVDADVMDRMRRDGLRARGRVMIHDATQQPWPVGDRAYDLFVALQVFEHLGTAQAAAFREVRRVARNAILSLPIDWVMADPRNCHHLLSEERVLSWFAPVVPTRSVVCDPGRRKRVIYVFEDLPPLEPENGVEALGAEP